MIRPMILSMLLSGSGSQPLRCCTVVTPEAIISNAE